MKLVEVLGDRFVNGADDAVAYEGPIAGTRGKLNVAETILSIAAAQDALERQAEPGSRVGVLSNHQVETYVSVLSCITSNRTFIPLNPKFPESRLDSVLTLGAVDVILTDEKSAGIAARVAGGRPVVDMSAILSAWRAPDPVAAAPLLSSWRQRLALATADRDAIAYIMFTSGSTGIPKGVPISYGNLQSYVSGVTDLVEIPRGLRFTQFFDLSFDLSIHDIFISNVSWGTLVAPSAIDLMMPSGYISRELIDVWFSVPLVGAQLAQAKVSSEFAGLQHILFCGETLPMETVIGCRPWQAEGGHMWNLYGPTEATIAFTAAEITNSDCSHGSTTIGMPFGANEVAVSTGDGIVRNPPAGTEGELLLGGPQVFTGYSTNVDSPFVGQDDHWYRSGDLIRVDDDGLFFRGRVDSQVKYRGYRIELGEIENAIRRQHNVNTVAVVLVGDAAMARIVAYYIDSECPGGIDLEVLGRDLPAYMVPSTCIGLEQMPVNANHKIDRRQLAERQD